MTNSLTRAARLFASVFVSIAALWALLYRVFPFLVKLSGRILNWLLPMQDWP